mgnify:CR=1 FL=1
MDNPVLLLPSDGNVHVHDALNLSDRPVVVKAHNSPLAALALSTDGGLLATCSEKGTVIRVFALPDWENVKSFRRGSFVTNIHDLRVLLFPGLFSVF